jgi:hypothetical protein
VGELLLENAKFKEPSRKNVLRLSIPSGPICASLTSAKYTLIQMFAGIMASQWQLCQNAVALQENFDVALDLLLAPLDRASEEGSWRKATTTLP